MLKKEKEPTVAVFGALGYTGKFVVAELLKRRINPVAVARNFEELKAHFGSDSRVATRRATIDDAELLDRAIADADVVINCAGPFAKSAVPLVEAAIRAGAHYLDIAAEQNPTLDLFQKYDSPAKAKNLVVMPAVGIFGASSDLMATALMGEWKDVDSIDIMLGYDSWETTIGSKNTIAGVGADPRPAMMVTGGALSPWTFSEKTISYTFDQPIGQHDMLECPLSEVQVIFKHVKVQELHSYVTSIALSQLLNPNTPAPLPDESGRSPQQFILEVIVKRGSEIRRGTIEGRDGYAATAPIICEVAERLIKGEFKKAGAVAPAEIFEAENFLKSLGDEVKFKLLAAV